MIYKTNESALNDTNLVVVESSNILNEDKQVWATSNTLSRVTQASEDFKECVLKVVRGYKDVFNDALDRKVGEGDWSRRLSSSLSTFLIWFLGGYVTAPVAAVVKMLYNNMKDAETKISNAPARNYYTITFNARGNRKDDRGQPAFGLISEIIQKAGLTKKGTSGSYSYFYKEEKDRIYLAYYDESRNTFLKAHNLCVNMLEIENSKENKDTLKRGSFGESGLFSNLELI